MADPDRSLQAWLPTWLATRLLMRSCGRSLDLDAIPRARWRDETAPLPSPITLVTAWNPGGRERSGDLNRTANRRLRAELESRGWPWRPALGRAGDGSWAEPGFAVGGLDEAAAARLGAEWGQLAVYVVTADEVVVLASSGRFRVARPRGTGGTAPDG